MHHLNNPMQCYLLCAFHATVIRPRPFLLNTIYRQGTLFV